MSVIGFTGKTVVVTGGSGGLGRRIVTRFAELGANVVIADVDGDSARDLAGDLNVAGHTTLAVGVDVTSEESVRALVTQSVSTFGQIDVLINNAGGSLGTPRDLQEISASDFDLVLNVNLKGAFLCCQASVPHMPQGSAIVNISSIGGRSTTPVTGVPYAAAKAGVLGLTRRLAREVGPVGIRVNAIAPGLFLSGDRLEGMWASLSADERTEVLDAIPLRRLPDPSEAVGPILFLASGLSSYITGAVLDVNGGRFMA
jgi:NAD(P)-dependent dehydrogenase (short-subunit alcohol dehydrogenase family)